MELSGRSRLVHYVLQSVHYSETTLCWLQWRAISSTHCILLASQLEWKHTCDKHFRQVVKDSHLHGGYMTSLTTTVNSDDDNLGYVGEKNEAKQKHIHISKEAMQDSSCCGSSRYSADIKCLHWNSFSPLKWCQWKLNYPQQWGPGKNRHFTFFKSTPQTNFHSSNCIRLEKTLEGNSFTGS